MFNTKEKIKNNKNNINNYVAKQRTMKALVSRSGVEIYKGFNLQKRE